MHTEDTTIAELLRSLLPRMKAASFTIDQVQEKLEAAIASGR